MHNAIELAEEQARLRRATRIDSMVLRVGRLAGVDPDKQSGTIRHFRKIVTLAHGWWLTDGAAERCRQLLDNGERPPLMFYLIWSDYTQLAKHIAAATVFGSSISRAAKLVALPPDLIARFEAAQDPMELDGDAAQRR